MQIDQPQQSTRRRVIFALLASTLVLLTAALDATIVYDAVVTPSALDPARSELAVCGPIVFWRILWNTLWAANFLPPFLSGASAHPQVYSRTRVLAAIAICAWLPLGIVLLAAVRTPCATAAPHMWDGALNEVLWRGLPIFGAIALIALIAQVAIIVQRIRERRSMPVLPTESRTAAVVVDSKE
ncbi:hypothetical protein BV25DRAFT_1822017 [Artomyces pyxidatus]|uniref:Uncharacterized protein n=1 Tax=Artomyces pyxidatus TaxID=48021 RepID=A0ACB8TAJ9_9AGAM|nr:hypothetical protein BV25DRAFT_1822017 [Artomyces pyxidatus]